MALAIITLGICTHVWDFQRVTTVTPSAACGRRIGVIAAITRQIGRMRPTRVWRNAADYERHNAFPLTSQMRPMRGRRCGRLWTDLNSIETVTPKDESWLIWMKRFYFLKVVANYILYTVYSVHAYFGLYILIEDDTIVLLHSINLIILGTSH